MILAASPVAFLGRLIAPFRDPAPLTIGAAYAQLRSVCLRDCPGAQCTITLDGVYAYFTCDPSAAYEPNELLEISVHIKIQLVAAGTQPARPAYHVSTVRISAAGHADIGSIDLVEETMNCAIMYAGAANSMLKRWGWTGLPDSGWVQVSR